MFLLHHTSPDHKRFFQQSVKHVDILEKELNPSILGHFLISVRLIRKTFNFDKFFEVFSLSKGCVDNK